MTRRRIILVTVLSSAALATSSAIAAWTHVTQATALTATVETLGVPTVTAPGAATTSNKTVTITWKASRTSATNVSASSYVVSRSDAPNTSVCTITKPPLSCTNTVATDGSYSYTVKALLQSWTSSNASGTVVIDSTGPAVTITSPATDGTTITGTGTSFAGAVGTATRDLSPVTVTVLSGATTVASPIATGSGAAWSTGSVTLGPGAYTVRAVQSDSVGNTTTVNRTFTMAAPVTGAPSAPVLDVSTDSGVTGDNITNVQKPKFSGTAPVGSSVSLYVDGSSTAAATGTATGGNYALTVSGNLAAGATHSVTAKATVAGQQPSAASDATSVLIDTTAPALTATSAARTGAVGSGTGTASGGQGGNLATTSTSADGVVTAKICSGNQNTTGKQSACAAVSTASLNVTSTAGASTWSATWTGLATGSYTFVVTQSDVAGNVSWAGSSTFNQ